MQRITTGYEYEVMLEVSDRDGEAWREYNTFMARVFR